MKINGKNVSEFKIPFTKKEIHDFLLHKLIGFLYFFVSNKHLLFYVAKNTTKKNNNKYFWWFLSLAFGMHFRNNTKRNINGIQIHLKSTTKCIDVHRCNYYWYAFFLFLDHDIQLYYQHIYSSRIMKAK